MEHFFDVNSLALQDVRTRADPQKSYLPLWLASPLGRSNSTKGSSSLHSVRSSASLGSSSESESSTPLQVPVVVLLVVKWHCIFLSTLRRSCYHLFCTLGVTKSLFCTRISHGGHRRGELDFFNGVHQVTPTFIYVA
jgi:hypothetical protein